MNRAIERARELRLRSWLLRQRARRDEGAGGGRGARAREADRRAPLVVVTPFLGTKLVDGRGRSLWGDTRRLFFGLRFAGRKDVHTKGPLEELPIVPGLYAQDILGGLLRFLERAAGFVRGEDLFVLEYDFREGVAHAAARLAELVGRIRGAGTERVDLVGVSSGGTIARYFLAYGGADAVREDRPASQDPAALVRRVIYVGAPQRGTFGALAQLHAGVVFVPGGSRVPPRAIATCHTAADFLPHPDDALFIDERGRTLKLDLYQADTWVELGLAGGLRGFDRADFQEKLDLGRRLHRALDGASTPHPDAIVIGGRHQPTRARVLVARGRAVFPPCAPDPADPFVGYIYEPGDGSLPESSLRAVPGATDDNIWLVRPAEHHLIPADPDVHRLVVEALLASDRPLAAARAAVKSPQSLVRGGG